MRYLAILAEFGACRGKGIGRVDELIALAQTDAKLPQLPIGVGCLTHHLEGRQSSKPGRTYRQGARTILPSPARSIPPVIGTLIASAVARQCSRSVVFRSGGDFAAWLGLTPRQKSSGGKDTSAPHQTGPPLQS